MQLNYENIPFIRRPINIIISEQHQSDAVFSFCRMRMFVSIVRANKLTIVPVRMAILLTMLI